MNQRTQWVNRLAILPIRLPALAIVVLLAADVRGVGWRLPVLIFQVNDVG
jgi:hypothetical protein